MHTHVWVPVRAREDMGSPGAGVADGHELPCGCWKSNWGPLQGQQALKYWAIPLWHNTPLPCPPWMRVRGVCLECDTMYKWRSENHLKESVLSFCCMGSRDWTEVIQLSDKCLHPQSHFTHTPSLEIRQPFSTCGSWPFWGRLNDPFIGVTYQISHISDIYIMIHNKSQITVTKLQQKQFCGWGGHHNMRICIRELEH